MGFSAGGHLASSLGTSYDEENRPFSERPGFMVLVIPVISADSAAMHRGSFRNLLGETPDPDLMTRFSTKKQVTSDTPPTFLAHAADDVGVPVANSILFFEALQDHGVPAALHIFPSGGH